MRDQQRAHLSGLVVAVFEQQRAAGREMIASASDDGAQGRQAIAMVGQRVHRLEAQIAFGKVDVAAGNVRWIGRDQVKAFAAKGSVPVAVQKAHRDAVGCGIGAGDVERARAGVEGAHAHVRAAVGNRDGDGAAAGAHVEQRRIWRQPFERQLDQQFGVGARDQHGVADGEIEAVEFAPADDVGDRLAGHAARDQRAQELRFGASDGPLRLRDQADARQIQRVAQQNAVFQRIERQRGLDCGERGAGDDIHRRGRSSR